MRGPLCKGSAVVVQGGAVGALRCSTSTGAPAGPTGYAGIAAGNETGYSCSMLGATLTSRREPWLLQTGRVVQGLKKQLGQQR